MKEYPEGHTVVTANGTILQRARTGTGELLEQSRGLIIVAEDERCPIMEMGEVSDDDLVHVFINCLHKIQKVELTKGEQEDPDWWGTHEIEVQRKGEGMAFKIEDEE